MHISNLRPVRTKVETLLAPNKIFNENLKQNALEYLAFGKNFIGIASEMLEFLE